jgi:heme/copper-type cytochrome/quinol oxidase subunit 3
MPQPENVDQPRSMVVQRPKSNIYTALLGVSAVALFLGCIFMLLEVVEYSQSFSPFEIYDAIGGP